MATVRMPSARAVRITRHAISPRLAMRSELIMSAIPLPRVPVASPLGRASGLFDREAEIDDPPAAIDPGKIELVVAAVREFAVDVEGIRSPDGCHVPANANFGS